MIRGVFMPITISMKSEYEKVSTGTTLQELYPGCLIDFKGDKIDLDSVPDDFDTLEIREALGEPSVGIIKIER
jgi:hypothetical protein